jgi:glucose-1-phosphate thymidylyltransferase
MGMASTDAAFLRRGVILTGGFDRYATPGIHTVRALAPIANEPILCYALKDLADAGVDEVAIVVSPNDHEPIRSVAADGDRWGLQLTYIEQEEPFGEGQALLAVEHFTGGRPFVVHRADGLLRTGLRPLLDEFGRAELDALMLVQPGGSRQRYLLAASDGGATTGFTAPPSTIDSPQVLAGVHAFGPRIFEAARTLSISRRAPLTLAAVADELARSRGRVEMRAVEGWWGYDGSPAELLRANRLLLDDLAGDLRGVDLLDSRVEGRVAIHPTATLTATTVRGPSIIGPRACLSHAYVGPYTSLGARVVVEGAEIEDSIILPGAIIRHLGRRLEASVVGSEAKVHRDFALPAALRLWVGDRVEVSLG